MIAIQHPVNSQIFQYYYLKSLIESYRYYVEEWLNKTLKDITDNAIASSEGDKEIEASIYSQDSNAVYDKTDSEDVLFYKAMLIMVYSYYEGIISKEKVTFLYESILPLRNYLCHNDSGTKGRDYEKTAKALKNLFRSRCIEINYQTNSEGKIILEKCSLYWINKDFIIDVLDKEHDVLIELSEIAGYKNTYIGKHEK